MARIITEFYYKGIIIEFYHIFGYHFTFSYKGEKITGFYESLECAKTGAMETVDYILKESE